MIINKKRKKKKEKKNSKHFCKYLLGILGVSLSVMQFTEHQLTIPKLIRSYLEFEIDYLSHKIILQSTKQKKNHEKDTFCFYLGIFYYSLVFCKEWC